MKTAEIPQVHIVIEFTGKASNHRQNYLFG